MVLRKEGGNGRKGLANSFLNRFVKLYIPQVHSDMQMSYLTQKYPYLSTDQPLSQLVLQLLEEQKSIMIEQLEFIVQLGKIGLLQQALDILGLPHKVTDNGQYASFESEVLKLLPLSESFGVGSAELVKTVIMAYLVFKYSNFSLCLVGQRSIRLAVVKAMAYLLNRNTVNILISTMLDINDLLGTYEQVTDSEAMEVEQSMFEKIFAREGASEFKSEQTKFVFVESKVVTSLNDDSNLVYVEVPSETIAQRIEKGLPDVYNQTRKMVMGTDSLGKRASLAKFITLTLEDEEEDTISAS